MQKSLQLLNFSETEGGEIPQVSIPPSVTKIEKYAFYGCSSLEQISISLTLTEICDSAFIKMRSLKRLALPLFLTRISGNNALRNCKLLKQISIPSSISYINGGCFAN